jgi:hypothetical protein
MSEFAINHQEEYLKDVEYFTVLGSQEYLDNDKNPRITTDNNKVLAKRIHYYNSEKQIVKSKTRHLIKVGAHGRIYNPIGLYTEGRANVVNKKIGREEFRMKEVNENTFNLYLSFLRTKNPGHLTLAERGMQ